MLLNKLKRFVKSSLDSDVIKSTIDEIRPLYKSKQPMRKIVYHIFNSMFNRTPNLKLTKIRAACLGYMFRIGSGVASYNNIPISWIVNNVVGWIKNFILKDRGHIFETVIILYSHKWKLDEVIKYCKVELEKVTSNMNVKMNIDDDPSRFKARRILTEVLNFLQEERASLKSKGIKVGEMTITIEAICDNNSDFNHYINKQTISIEVRKESIWAHCKEMLNTNNIVNKWIDYLKAYLSFTEYVMTKSGSDEWLKTELEIERIQTELNSSDIWTLKDGYKSAPILLRDGIKYFKERIEEYADVIPFKLLGSTYYEPDFTKTSGGDFLHRTDSDIYNMLTPIYDFNVDYETAHERIKIFEEIVKQKTYWKSFFDAKDALFKQYENTTYQITNLEHCTVESESFGMACTRACFDLVMKTCDDRHSETSIRNVVMKFTTKLIEQLETVCDDETIFVEGSMEKRHSLVVIPAYENVLSDKETTLSKKELRTIHYNELMDTYFDDNTPKTFNIINPTEEKYNDPVIKTLDFSKIIDDTKNSGFDLGQKIQTDGYSEGNTFLQATGHNRSKHKSNHTIGNKEYMQWFADENQKLVDYHRKYFLDNERYEVLADATKLVEIFSVIEEKEEEGEFV